MGGYYAAGNEFGMNIERGEHRYVFHGEHRFAEFGQLLLKAYDELNALPQ